MIEYKTELKKILLSSTLDNLDEKIQTITGTISEKDLASFFVETTYLRNIIQLIIEDHWIKSKSTANEIQYDRFIKKFINQELKPLLFLHSFFEESSIEDLKVALKAITQTELLLVKTIKSKPSAFQKKFLQITLQQMSELFELEHQINLTHKKPTDDAKMSLYRCFDTLDQIFELEYILNEIPEIDQKERLYEGAGVGVQSSYATTLLALRYLNLSKKSRFIDLGSGYGRIGFVIGLMRPDIQFTGYEYVKERVNIANKICSHLLLDQHVHFIAQDLSSPEFKIPMADTYYIFDAFSDASYAIVMEQLQQLTYLNRITVVTKGNAKHWMNNKFWSEPQELNDGNICIYRSKARPKSI